MENLMIERTKSTPQIEFSYDRHQLSINGQSYPENAFNFYEPVTKWIDDYLALEPEIIVVEIDISYINSSSSKCLTDILDKFEEAHQKGIQVKLNWYCNEENESELECAEEFLEDLTFEHQIITGSVKVKDNE